MSFLKSIVFFNIMKVISSHDNCIFHFGGNDHASTHWVRGGIGGGAYLMILPLMETLEVNGHFLSTYLEFLAVSGVLKPRPTCFQYLVTFTFLSLRSLLVF